MYDIVYLPRLALHFKYAIQILSEQLGPNPVGLTASGMLVSPRQMSFEAPYSCGGTMAKLGIHFRDGAPLTGDAAFLGGLGGSSEIRVG